jgi:hypothetical protein
VSGDICPNKCWFAVLCRFWLRCSRGIRVLFCTNSKNNLHNQHSLLQVMCRQWNGGLVCLLNTGSTTQEKSLDFTQRKFCKIYRLLRLIAGLSPPKFDLRPVHLGLVGEIAREPVSLRVFKLSTDASASFILHRRGIPWAIVSSVK